MEGFEKPRTKSLLEHFSEVEDFATHERRVTQSLLLAVRSHWQIENALHWVLDVTFKDDLSRVRKGHGAKNIAIVRHFALNLVRNAKTEKASKSEES